MKLIYLGEELDSSVEHEIMSNDKDHPHGFDVIVTWKEQDVQTRHNCTEVHHRYKDVLPGEGRIAFESDIHGTGGTQSIFDLESVEIVKAIQHNDDHFGKVTKSYRK